MPKSQVPVSLCLRFIGFGAVAAGFAGFQLTRDWSREMWGLFLGMAILGVASIGVGLALWRLAPSAPPKHVRLGAILRWRYKLNEEILTEIAEKSRGAGKRLGEMAVELGYLTEEELTAALREQQQLNAGV